MLNAPNYNHDLWRSYLHIAANNDNGYQLHFTNDNMFDSNDHSYELCIESEHILFYHFRPVNVLCKCNMCATLHNIFDRDYFKYHLIKLSIPKYNMLNNHNHWH